MDINYQADTTTIEKLAKEAFDGQNRSIAKNYALNIEQVKKLTNELILEYDKWANIEKKAKNYTIELQVIAKKFFVKNFFSKFVELQNLLNKINNQKVLITYVHVDGEGRREIRIADNTINNIVTTVATKQWTGASYAKTEYLMKSHYQLLRNSLSDDDNKGLQEVAAEVSRRQEKDRKHRVFWQYKDEWYGYRIFNKGPINEAFASFFIENIKLQGTLESRIHIFMLSKNPQGVIWADNANGFFMGDLHKGGLQFAVKGKGGSIQGTKRVVEALKKLQAENYSFDAYQALVEAFTTIEQKKATPLVAQMSKRSIEASVKAYYKKVEKDIKDAIK